MPPNFFQKPETALKRAQELTSVGKELDALETLHDTIKVRLVCKISCTCWKQFCACYWQKSCGTSFSPIYALPALYFETLLGQFLSIRSATNCVGGVWSR